MIGLSRQDRQRRRPSRELLGPDLQEEFLEPLLAAAKRADPDPGRDQPGQQVGRLLLGPAVGDLEPPRPERLASRRPAGSAADEPAEGVGSVPSRTSITRTPPPMIRSRTSSTVPLTTIRPRSMMATAVQNSVISARMCEEIRIVLPSAASRLQDVLQVDPPPRVDPAGRLVEQQDLRVGDQGLGQHHPLPHPPGEFGDHRAAASRAGRLAPGARRSPIGRSGFGIP